MPTPTSDKENNTGARTWLAPLLLLVAAILFVVFCLILEEWQSGTEAPDRPTLIKNVFISEAALIVYCTILAGVLGTAVRILTNRLSTQTSSSVAQSVGSVVAQVFLGAAFAFAVAFLVPHALATRTISASYNVWSLMILGGVAGYASSGIAGSVREGLQGLLSGLRQGVAEAIVKEEVSKTIAESAKEALALPEPVAYAGIVEVEVADERGISAVKTFSRPTAPAGSPETLPEGPGILLEADTTYSIRIYLIPHVASRGPRPTRPIVFPIDIEGMRVPVVPLEVRVDYGFQELEIARHQAEARVDSETELRPFTFKAPSVPDPVALTATPDAEPSISRRLTIAILQNKIPYVRRQIPITLAATGFSPPESSSMPASS